MCGVAGCSAQPGCKALDQCIRPGRYRRTPEIFSARWSSSSPEPPFLPLVVLVTCLSTLWFPGAGPWLLCQIRLIFQAFCGGSSTIHKRAASRSSPRNRRACASVHLIPQHDWAGTLFIYLCIINNLIRNRALKHAHFGLQSAFLNFEIT